MAPTSETITSLPSVLTVWKIARRGDPAKALVKDQNGPVPTKIPKGYVLVKIQAASLNPVYVPATTPFAKFPSLSHLLRRGSKLMQLVPNSFFKRIPEYDFAGEVVDANGNPGLKVWDQVFGSIPRGRPFKNGQGALAQCAYVPAKLTTHRPEGIFPNEASGWKLAKGSSSMEGPRVWGYTRYSLPRRYCAEHMLVLQARTKSS